MNLFESITLFGIIAVLAIIPSTSVALVVSQSATLGIANGIAASAGIVLGDLLFILLAILGMTVVADVMGSLFMLVKILGGFYLLWLGFSLLLKTNPTKATIKNNRQSILASFAAGFILTLGDIKAIVFYASLLPIFVNLSTIQVKDIVVIIFITVIGVGGMKFIYVFFASKIVTYAQKANMEIVAKKIVGGIMVIGAGGYLMSVLTYYY